MAYQAPTVGPQGLSIPSYQDILNLLLQQFTNIYGSNVYLADDSADYQFFSIIALKLSDGMKAIQLVYNNRGPLTAVGSALDGLVKLNGLARHPATYSSCQLTLTGTPGAVITNGVCQDTNGFFWDLPATVTIGGGGTVTVGAICETIGAISAGVNQINIISTVTAGWTSVTNSGIAVTGQPVESDSQLRGRQSISTALPSITMLAGTIAGIEATFGVTRNNVLENPTGTFDIWGNPSHSITCVVEGGSDLAVATAIFDNRGIGCYTNGNVGVVVTDPNTAVTTTIRFDRPTYVQLTVIANIHLITGTSATLAAIQAAIVTYLNSLQIGELLTVSGIYAAILALVGNPSEPIFSIRGLTVGYTSIVTAIAVNAAGTGYAVNDTLAILQSGSSLGATAVVTSVGGSGNVTGVSLIQNGVDYTTASSVPTSTSGAGTGCTINVTAGTAQGTLDLAVHFYEVTQGVSGNVTVNQV